MTLKLTSRDQADALFNVFEMFVLPEKPVNPEERLVILMLLKVYKKIRAKLEATFPHGYCITLTPEEAVAYVAFFRGHHLEPTMIYERALIDMQTNEFHRQLF